jgi:hypothetical protein
MAFEKERTRKGRSNAHIEDTERLVTEEIEMLKVVLYLVIGRAATIILADYIYMCI